MDYIYLQKNIKHFLIFFYKRISSRLTAFTVLNRHCERSEAISPTDRHCEAELVSAEAISTAVTKKNYKYTCNGGVDKPHHKNAYAFLIFFQGYIL